MVTVDTMYFSKLLNSWAKILWEKIVGYAGNPRGSRPKRIELLKFGLREVNNFVRHHDNSVRPNLIQILPNGYLHIVGMHSKSLLMGQDKIDAFMATI